MAYCITRVLKYHRVRLREDTKVSHVDAVQRKLLETKKSRRCFIAMLEPERNLVMMTIYKHSGMRAMDGNRTGHVCEQEGHENINTRLSKLTDEGVELLWAA